MLIAAHAPATVEVDAVLVAPVALPPSDILEHLISVV
jgi:hypothetical protein